MRPLDFYDLGLRFAASAETEAEWRTVAGRLYYGLHHDACCRYFREYPDARPLPRRGRHVALIRRFDGIPGGAGGHIARFLTTISQMRNACDYELTPLVRLYQRELSAEQVAKMALVVANGLLAALESFSPGEAPDGCDCPTSR